MFIDEVKVSLKAGNGGDGCLSFHRAKYVPLGGPDGGNGGKGGDLYLLCDQNQGDLTDYRFRPIWKAKNGEPGRGKQQHGKGGGDLDLKVPPGTVVFDQKTGRIVTELTEPGQRVCLLKGGAGGVGNLTFKTSTNQAPRETTEGTPCEEGEFRFVLKTIADVGLTGLPNAGKSSMLVLLTNANPKTADYPFTTKFPSVGVMHDSDSYETITLADIPGLIEGASENRGLGHRFLKHIERCKLLLILIDMSGTEGRKPEDDYRQLMEELRLYDHGIYDKPRLVVANKMDEENAAKLLKNFRKSTGIEPLPVSLLAETGIDELRKQLVARVKEIYKSEQK